ncbi:MAG TPA: AAA family ATPase [Bryobacteraceae bacterium]|nr:AAA family ATPase [Bryobacteraceae bacterium]
MDPLRIGLVIATQGLFQEVQACLKSLPVRVLLQQPAIGDTSAFLDQVEQLRLDVLLIDLTRLSEPFENVVRRIKTCSTPPQIIALNDTADPEVILGAIRAGASEFLYPPIEAGLSRALERLSTERSKAQAAPGRHRGKTLGFISAKGGCGATTVASHTAVEIQRATTQEVLLADFDMESGLVGFLMKSKSSYTVLDAVRNVHRLDQSYWKALVSNGIPGLEVISAPATATLREPLAGESLRHVLQFTRGVYDWIVVDMGRGLNTLTASVLEEIDEMYLIATLDLPALHQTKQVVQAALDTGYSRNRLRLIVNRAPKRIDFDLAQVQKVLGLPIFEMLPNSYPELFEAYSEGNLLSAGTELGKALGGLAVKITGVQPPNPKEKGKQKLGLSIF